MKLTFCLTTFNKLELLRITLENYFSNKKSNYELVVSDGFSTDGTVLYLKRLYADKLIDNLVLSTERDQGEWDGYRKTLEKVTGDYFYFLTDDDYFHFPTIDMIFSWLESNTDVDYLIANGFNIRPNDTEFLNYHQIFKNHNSTKPEVNGLHDGTCGLGLFVKRHLIEKLELFSPKYGKRADKTITLTLMNSKYKGASCSLPTYVSVKNEKSNSQIYNFDYTVIEQQQTLEHDPDKNFLVDTESFRKHFDTAETLINNFKEIDFGIYIGQ